MSLFLLVRHFALQIGHLRAGWLHAQGSPAKASPPHPPFFCGTYGDKRPAACYTTLITTKEDVPCV